jgi:hypothetical protein
LKQTRRHLTYANVMSSLAVFLILGGATAFAAVSKVGANEIKANSIKTGKIVKEAVTAGKIKKNAITESRIANGAVTTNKIADNAVTTNKIANDAVTGDKVKESSLSTVPLATSASQLGGKPASAFLPRYAFVAANGTVAQGVGVEKVFHEAASGFYFVRFNQSIANSAIAATLINDGAGESQINFRLCEESLPLGENCSFETEDVNNNRTIFVNTENSTGTNEDEPFVLTVLPEG